MSTVSLDPDRNFGDLVEKFVVDDMRFTMFERLLSDGSFTLQSSTLKGLRLELEKTLNETLDFAMAHRVTLCLEKLDELLAVEATVAELLEPIHRALDARRRHLKYLQTLQRGLRSIEKAKRRHSQELCQAEVRMEAANRISLSLCLPPILLQVADEHNVALRLAHASSVIAKRAEFGRSEAVKGLSFAPLVTHKLKDLIRKKVVFATGLWPETADVRLRFILMNGGVDITMLVRRNGEDSIVRQISLSEERLRDLRKADSEATLKLPDGEDPLVVFATAKLVELLADAAAGR